MDIKGCLGSGCLMHMVTKLANLGLVLFSLFLLTKTYGDDRFLVLLLCVPPLLSLIALRKCGDKEERALKARIRKAKLRQELHKLSQFDQPS